MPELQHGFGRLVVAVYAVFALSSTARSVYQIATKFEVAPLAYLLSALAGVVYLVATWALGTGRAQLATWAISFELAGVLLVGALTTVSPDLFADGTVWSQFGADYAWVPLVLPLVGIGWIWWHRRGSRLETR